MSEFSDSWHLRANDRREGVKLLVTAKLPGYVFDAVAGWVSFVVPRHLAPERVVAANRSLLVRYEFAGDHGCVVTVYDGANQIAQIDASFESRRPGRFDRDELVECGLLTESDAAAIAQWVANPDRDQGLLIVASRLRLPHHELFAFDYVDRKPNRVGCIEVRTDGTVVGDESIADVEEALPVTPALALVQTLVATNAIELVRGGDIRALAEDLSAALAEQSDADPEVIVRELLMDHPCVEEIYGDDAAIQNAITAAAGRA